MTQPKITYKQGYFNDCEDSTEAATWVETEDGCTATLTVDSGDFFLINVTNAVGNKIVYYEKDITNISTTAFPKLAVQYKTAGPNFKIVFIFTDGTQTILDETTSSTWLIASLDVTPEKILDKIRIYATNAIGSVYINFLIVANQFTIPSWKVLDLVTSKKIARLQIPGKDGDIIQDFGLASPEIIMRGDMMSGEAWGTPPGEPLYYVIRDDEPWQLFTSDKINCKLKPTHFTVSQDEASGQQGTYDFRGIMETNLSDLGGTTWASKQWFGK